MADERRGPQGGRGYHHCEVAQEARLVGVCVVTDCGNGSGAETSMIQALQAIRRSPGRRGPRTRRGFTIIELMIVVVIIGVLVAIVFPSYQSAIRKANRRHCQAAMMELAQRENQYLMDQRSFGTMADVGYGLPAEVDRYYTFAVTTSAGPPPSFTITATPKSGTTQANDGAMTLNNVGAKAPADKW